MEVVLIIGCALLARGCHLLTRKLGGSDIINGFLFAFAGANLIAAFFLSGEAQ